MQSDSVVDRLRHDILDGVFSPGERLIEVEISERYQCGRAAIRAALVQLESEVLVDRKANRGAVVRRIPVSEAIEITEARRALEGLIAAAAAHRGTEADFADLKRIIEDMRNAVADGDAASYATLNRELHEKLMSMSQHTVASELVRNLRHRGVQNQFRLAMVPGRQAVSVEQHAAIVGAVLKRDGDAAAKAMSEHLDSVIDVLGRWEEVRDRSG